MGGSVAPRFASETPDRPLCTAEVDAAEVDAAEVDPPWIGLAVVTGVIANRDLLHLH